MKYAEMQKINLFTLRELCEVEGAVVTVFSSFDADDEYYWGTHGDLVITLPWLRGESWHDQKTRILKAADELLHTSSQNVVFTGIHKETDWSRSYWFDKGWHICNTTGDYAVLSLAPTDIHSAAIAKIKADIAKTMVKG